MKILRVHNRYAEPGGETGVELAERRLLQRAGHALVVYERSNAEIGAMGLAARAALPARAVWARDVRRELAELIARERPDVAHFSNTFPLISPLAYDACRDAGVPVVQSLHNYRLLCPAGSFVRRGRICEDCVERGLLESVRHGCYRGSRAATAVVAGMLAVHRRRGTFAERVDAYVAPSRFARAKLVAGGLPAERIFVKPNFAEDPGPRPEGGDYALYVGRLAPEKGPFTLIHAWEELGDRVPLRIAGDGPLQAALRAQVARAGLRNVRFLGWLPPSEVRDELRRARFLVFQSECYETFGLGIVEAFAAGTPVLAPRLGAMAELVEDGRSGLHYAPRDAADLAAVVLRAWQNPKPLEDMGRAARAEYEAHYTPERNLERMMEIYERARERRAPASTPPGLAPPPAPRTPPPAIPSPHGSPSLVCENEASPRPPLPRATPKTCLTRKYDKRYDEERRSERSGIELKQLVVIATDQFPLKVWTHPRRCATSVAVASQLPHAVSSSSTVLLPSGLKSTTQPPRDATIACIEGREDEISIPCPNSRDQDLDGVVEI